jgi:hypothetical protein
MIGEALGVVLLGQSPLVRRLLDPTHLFEDVSELPMQACGLVVSVGGVAERGGGMLDGR